MTLKMSPMISTSEVTNGSYRSPVIIRVHFNEDDPVFGMMSLFTADSAAVPIHGSDIVDSKHHAQILLSIPVFQNLILFGEIGPVS